MQPHNHTTDFKGNWFVVTGASSGIGRGICQYLHQHNARLIMVGRDLSRLQATTDEIGINACHLVVADLQQADFESSIQPVLTQVGAIHGLCHAAGIASTRALRVLKPAILHEIMAVNVVAGLTLARLVTARQHLPQTGSSLLFISSVYSHVGGKGQVAYCATKGALNAAVRAMAIELAPKKVKVNSMSPGFIDTPLSRKELTRLGPQGLQDMIERHPLGAGTVDQVARSALFLLAPENQWITGIDLAVDGGFLAI